MTKPQPAIHVDHLIRTNRRTVALVVTRDGHLIVRAPLRMSMKTIEAFIEQKRAWILEKQAQARAYTNQVIPHSFTEGETFLYLGHTYPLLLSDRQRPTLALEAIKSPPAGSPPAGLKSSPFKLPSAVFQPGIFPPPAGSSPLAVSPPLPFAAGARGDPSTAAPTLAFILARSAQPNAREVFVRWYRAQAQRVLSERIDHWSAQTGLVSRALRITSARTRWGSCSSRDVLSFPWRLIMAPLPVVDYVVVHELVHLKEKNHARPFWQGVAAILPGYAHQVAWLKENGHLLTI